MNTSNIKCLAKKCIHNCDDCCDAAVVHVRPSKQGNEWGGRCTTYAYKINNAGSKLLMEMGDDMSLSRKTHNDSIAIACGMHNCSHFKDYTCGANKISIFSPEESASGECSCKTYNPKR